MKSKRGHWPALEALSGGAVMAEWALELGDEFERARSFLRSSGINADTYPCTNRFACECRHRVEPLRRGGWVAVCDCGGCEPIRLSEREVALFEPDVARLAEAVLILCGWDVQVVTTTVRGVWQAGTLGEERTPVFWWAGKSEDHLRRAVDELVHGGTMPFAVLTPTRAHLSLRIEALLKREGCVAVVLADLVALGDGGVLTLKGSPDAVRRQDEPEFVKALGNFRVGRVWGDCARLLQARVRSNPPATMPRLFTHNVPVDKWNEFQLSGLPGDDTVLESVQTGPDHQRAFLVKNLLTPATLRHCCSRNNCLRSNKRRRSQLNEDEQRLRSTQKPLSSIASAGISV